MKLHRLVEARVIRADFVGGLLLPSHEANLYLYIFMQARSRVARIGKAFQNRILNESSLLLRHRVVGNNHPYALSSRVSAFLSPERPPSRAVLKDVNLY